MVKLPRTLHVGYLSASLSFGTNRRSQGGPGWEVVSQRKYSCSPKIQHFLPPTVFGLATPLFGTL